MPVTPAWTIVWSAFVVDASFLFLLMLLYVVCDEERAWVRRALKVTAYYVAVETMMHGPMEWVAARLLIWWRQYWKRRRR